MKNSLGEKIAIFLFLILQVIMPNHLVGQNAEFTKNISGIVVDEYDIPLIGATVKVKESNIGTTTDLDGKFTIKASPKDILVINFIGYEPKEVVIGSRLNINIKLNENNVLINEVTVVGYGTQRKKDITGSISTVQSKDLNMVNAVSLDNVLQGKAAGVVITQNSAQPGGGMSINIRGHLNSNSEPLYVIDGVPILSTNGLESNKPFPGGGGGGAEVDGVDRSPLATINPNDIQTIDILKDASATAIYGSAAANGVVLITTKRGKEGKVSVQYSGSYSVQKVHKYWDMMNASDYMKYANVATKENWLFEQRKYPYGNEVAESGWPIAYSSEQVAAADKTYNHAKEIMQTGYIHDHNISLSGGSTNTHYFTSFNFYNQKGLVENSSFRRFSGRINLTHKITNWLKLDISTMYTDVLSDNPSIGGSSDNVGGQRQVGAAYLFVPYKPLRDENGNLNRTDDSLAPNPLSFNYIDDKTKSQRFFFAPNIEVKFFKDLKGNIILGMDRSQSQRSLYSPTEAKLPEAVVKNFGGHSYNEGNNYSLEGFLTYDKIWKENHQLSAVLGGGYYRTSGYNFSVSEVNFFTDAFDNNNLGIITNRDTGKSTSDRYERTKLSQFIRLNYIYKGRYILGMTTRRDGSSVFAENHRWGIFPGFSGSWIVSDEPFLRNSKTVNLLKIRAGWGTSGNEAGMFGYNGYSFYGTNPSNYFVIGDTRNIGIMQTQQGNPNLTWETDITVNVGIDAAFFNNRLTTSLDLFSKTAKDLLDSSRLPSVSPVTTVVKNVGSKRAQGFEWDVKGDIIQKKDFRLSAYYNMSWNIIKWVKRNPEVALNPWENETDAVFTYYGWKTDGIFKSLDEVQNYKSSDGTVIQPTSFPGNLRYVDKNDDGKLDKEDIFKLGEWNPIHFGFGIDIAYKGLELNVGTYGTINDWTKDGYNTFTNMQTLRLKNNQSNYIKDVWTSENPNGTRLGLATSAIDSNNETGYNDWTLQKTHFLRIKNLTLKYALPKKWFGNSLQGIKVFVDFQNLACFTNYKGLDPEMDKNASPYPIPFTTAMGININF